VRRHGGAACLATGLTVAALGGGLAAADASRPGGQTRFSGSCDFSGPIAFRPPLTNSTRSVAQRVRAPGRCSGTFGGPRGRTRHLTSARVTYFSSARGRQSCLSGAPTGGGVLLFRWGRLHFEQAEARTTAIAVASLSGARAGSAVEVARPAPSESPAASVKACSGSGITRLGLGIHLTTNRAISG
jgi:hypothetical protein